MAWWDNDPVADATAPAASGAQSSWFSNDPIAELIKNDARETAAAPAAMTAPAGDAAPTILEDVGMALATSPQEAAARVVGLPSALTETVGAVAPWAVEKVAGAISPRFTEEVAKVRAANPNAGRAPFANTAELKSIMDMAARNLFGESALGSDNTMFYQPQTRPGQVTQEGAVGALMGAPFGKIMAASGASSGVVGEGSRQVFEDFPTVAPIAEITGALVGGGLPFAARGLVNMTRPSSVLEGAMEGITPDQYARAQKLMDDARAMGVTLTGPEALQQVIGAQTRLGTLQRQVEMAPAGEGLLRPVMAGRAGEIQDVGNRLLTGTFGDLASPENVATRTQDAAEGILGQAMRNRTDLTQPSFATARTQTAPAQVNEGLEALKAKVDAEIALTGADNALGKKLANFRNLLDQPTDNLGPLIETNRTYAENLFKKYNPLDPDNTFNNREVASIAPFNRELQDILEGASPSYAGGLQRYRELSPDVRALEEGPIGRMAAPAGAPDTRIKQLSDEFLDPDLARPETIRQLAGQLGAVDPTVVPQLVGTRIQNVFDKATRELQSGPNPWGGAKFVTEVMGNPQARANLQATIETLPDGKDLWRGWQTFSEVMKATGKRLPRGSDTQANLGMAEELRQGISLPARAASRPLETLGGVVENWAARANSRELANIFTQPQAVSKMRELAELAPASRRAEVVAGEMLALVNTLDGQPELPEGEGLLNVPEQQAAPTGLLDMAPPPQGLIAPGSLPNPNKPAANVSPSRTMQLSDAERDALVRTLWGEARGESRSGQAAVAHVILNRRNHGRWGDTVNDVVTARGQFEPHMTERGRANMAALDPNSEGYQNLAAIVDSVVAGEMPDPTEGALYFFSPGTQRAMGRKTPRWARELERTANIGGHEFYR